MAIPLRKRLTRRQANEELRPKVNDETASPTTLPSTTEIPSAVTQPENTAITPAGFITTSTPARKSTLRRVAPSIASINPYRFRLPAGMDSSPSPAEENADNKTGKTTAFREDFDQSSTPLTAPSVTAPVQPEDSDPITVRGAQFEQMTGAKDEEGVEKRSSADVLPAVAPTNSSTVSDAPATRKRMTRSGSRREERADPGFTATQQESEVAKDFVDMRKDSGNAVPADLNVRKNSKPKNTRTPSPTKNEQLGPSTTANATGHSQSYVPTTPLISFCKNGTSTTKDMPSPDATLADAVTTLPAAHDSCTSVGSQEDMPDFEAGAMILSVPYYNAMRLPGYQWISCLSTTSRPEREWGWSKRWTCCHCESLTMVEQRDCAQLVCGHVRCGSGCRIIPNLPPA
ncbi:hypothetical protein LTR08_003897 [Meristemomyces frigidus]|nr:hypothetical protein LTR08_003897 [Meristemomyces frigidus]